MQVGSSTEATNIGAVANSGGRGIVVKGSITGGGVYKGVAGNGMVIGGLGQAVNVAGGMTVSGSIVASANEGTATALRVGAGSTVPVIEVSGILSASGGGTASTGSRTILIDAGGTVNTLRNTGTIRAIRAGADGTATAVLDNSGTLSLIENSGTLGILEATSLGDKAIAIDLRANNSGATVRQLAVTTGTAPTIIGDLLFGAGNDTLDIADGGVTGAAKFGTGNNSLSLSGDAVMNGAVTFGGGSDTMQLGGTSALFGDVDFGGGVDSLALAGTSSLTGQLLNSAGLAVNLGAGTKLNTTNLGTVSLASLNAGAGSSLGLTIDTATDSSTLFDVSGAADFGTGTLLDITLVSLANVEGTYKVLRGRHIDRRRQSPGIDRIDPLHLRQQPCHEHSERGFGHDPAKNGRGTGDQCVGRQRPRCRAQRRGRRRSDRRSIPGRRRQRESAGCLAADASGSRRRHV